MEQMQILEGDFGKFFVILLWELVIKGKKTESSLLYPTPFAVQDVLGLCGHM